MKVVLGVDPLGYYHPAIQLLKRLNFPELEAHFVHAVGSVMPDGSFPDVGQMHALAQILELRYREGRAENERAAQLMGLPENKTRQHLDQGDPARIMIELADKIGADLIAIGSEDKGSIGSFFLGSVGKGLLTAAHQSLLISKGNSSAIGPLKAVFATDHSEYNYRCLERLFEIRPTGLQSVTVVSASTIEPHSQRQLLEDLPHDTKNLHEWAVQRIEEQNEVICQRFIGAGVPCTWRFIEEHPHQALPKAMQETGADLLIMGAQGHSFWERLRIGSVSFRQALNEDYPVLVLRV